VKLTDDDLEPGLVVAMMWPNGAQRWPATIVEVTRKGPGKVLDLLVRDETTGSEHWCARMSRVFGKRLFYCYDRRTWVDCSETFTAPDSAQGAA
jgi:hypothetical protein